MNTLRRTAISFQLIALLVAGCQKHVAEQHEEPHKVVITHPVLQDVVLTQKFVCQIHSSRHIEVKALQSGYLESIPVKEGQRVQQDDVLFQVIPVLYSARKDSEVAEVALAQIERDNTVRLFEQNVVAKPEVALAEAKLSKAKAKLALADAELKFATVKSPFDGIIDHQHHQQGSLVEEGDVLTTLSDNSVMWVYFNVPEADYLEYQTSSKNKEIKVELVLANGQKFSQEGKIGAIEADFNNVTGNVAFRADFPNPDGLLRHGQTGTILLSHVKKNALVIPQRAKYEILAKTYVYVVHDEDKSKVDSKSEEHGAETAPHGAAEHAEAPVTRHSGPEAFQVVFHAEGTESAGEAGDAATEKSGHPAEDSGAAVEHAIQASGAKSGHAGEAGTPEEGEHQEVSDKPLGVVRQREIVIDQELEDLYIIKSGLEPTDKIILEGVRQVRDGGTVNYDYLAPAKVLSNLKYHAE